MLTRKDKILRTISQASSPLSVRQISQRTGMDDVLWLLEQLERDGLVSREKEWLTEMEKKEKGIPVSQSSFRWVFSR